MTRLILNFIITIVAIVAAWSVTLGSIDGINEYTRIVQGQACADTAIAKGWLKPAKGSK